MYNFFIQIDLHYNKCFLKFVYATSIFKTSLEWELESLIEENDFLLFSKYSVRILDENRIYIGLFNTFFKI
jgi:hypothetical protein